MKIKQELLFIEFYKDVMLLSRGCTKDKQQAVMSSITVHNSEIRLTQGPILDPQKTNRTTEIYLKISGLSQKMGIYLQQGCTV